jgi:hypothetical protein
MLKELLVRIEVISHYTRVQVGDIPQDGVKSPFVISQKRKNQLCKAIRIITKILNKVFTTMACDRRTLSVVEKGKNLREKFIVIELCTLRVRTEKFSQSVISACIFLGVLPLIAFRLNDRAVQEV